MSNEPKCKCGHPKSEHYSSGTGTCLHYDGVACDCPCVKFEPACEPVENANKEIK